ncbi:MAG: hypothetical protein K9J13_11545 [Saprospiraceae bacterium]|nr:hypothetical protein [Saprospiraceae bacterium]
MFNESNKSPTKGFVREWGSPGTSITKKTSSFSTFCRVRYNDVLNYNSDQAELKEEQRQKQFKMAVDILKFSIKKQGY